MKTEIILVLDRSSSMHSISDATIEGVNSFLADQKDVEGECNFTLHQFDTTHEVVFDAVPIKQVENLTVKTFRPRGCTALIDAIGMSIDRAGKRFAEMPSHKRPDTVIVAVMTDGQENSSTKYEMSDINRMIGHQTDKYGWDFMFLAANQDAIATGGSLGFLAGKSMTFNASVEGMGNSMSSVTQYMTNIRSGAVASSAAEFSDTDRDDALK